MYTFWNKTWNRRVPKNAFKCEHYSSIKDVMAIDKEKQIPNGIIITPEMLPVFSFCSEFKEIDSGVINGSYFCGYWEDTIPVVCAPYYGYDSVLSCTISIQYTDHEDIIKDLWKTES